MVAGRVGDLHHVQLPLVLQQTAQRRGDDRGQATAEYALLLLGAATIALIVVTWATSTGKIAELFDAVVDSIIGRV